MIIINGGLDVSQMIDHPHGICPRSPPKGIM